jgi:hypothetical protein
MAIYIWCKVCHQMIAKELLHEDCEPKVSVTPKAVKKQMGIK